MDDDYTIRIYCPAENHANRREVTVAQLLRRYDKDGKLGRLLSPDNRTMRNLKSFGCSTELMQGDRLVLVIQNDRASQLDKLHPPNKEPLRWRWELWCRQCLPKFHTVASESLLINIFDTLIVAGVNTISLEGLGATVNSRPATFRSPEA